MAKILNDEAIQALSDTKNNQLISDVADALNVSIYSMPMIVQRKSRRLTEFAPLKVLADFLHVEMDELLIDTTKVES
jgi:hypothetical protein